MDTSKSFEIESRIAASDKDGRLTREINSSRFEQSLNTGLKQYANLELARKRAGFIRYKAIRGLEKYLIEFESNFHSNGGKVIWATDAKEANTRILEIIKKNKASSVIKSKTLMFDELSLSQEFEKEGIVINETNPGSYLLSLNGEKPRHFFSMAMHKSLKEVITILNQTIKLPSGTNTIGIHNFIRKQLRPAIETTQVSITGANFLIADTGSVSISENEGDASLNSSMPKIQIVIAGIDKIIPSIQDLDTLLPLYSTYSSGERVSAFNTIVSGPRKEDEVDGPVEMYVVLVDNGRTDLLSRKFQRRAMSCIECGACQNVCPVYKTIGGKSYGTTYTGPVGSITTPWTKGFDEYIHLSYASTLCSKCTEVCPVGINIHEQLLYNRNDAVRMNTNPMSEGLKMKAWYHLLKSRKMMDWMNIRWKNIVLGRAYGSSFNEKKILPEIKQPSFNQLWEERKENNS